MEQSKRSPDLAAGTDWMGPIMRFFIFCSAANTDILRDCPRSEHHKYAGVGATIMTTGVLAGVSGGYALYTVFDSLWVAVALGFVWGAIIFNLDRFIVSTIKKSKKFGGEWRQMVPRAILAIFMAVIISKPLEMRIFQEEINEYLNDQRIEKQEQSDLQYALNVESKRNQITQIRNRTTTKDLFDLRAKYYQLYQCECAGTCGTGQRGEGRECLRAKEQFEKIEKEYLEAKTLDSAEIVVIREEIDLLTSEKQVVADGMLARLTALHNLPSGPSWMIILLLIAIETAPILTKLLSPYGPYDHKLRTVEYEYEIEEVNAINARNYALNSRLTMLAGLQKEQVEQEMDNNREVMELVRNAHLQLVKEQLDEWVEKERQKTDL